MEKIKPKPPLSRILKEGVGNWCPLCGSSQERIGFLGLFGKLSCLQPLCVNYIKKR
jgi:hypothetical protein